MHALITGASAGIGEGIARAFAAAGYDLTLVARRANELDRVASELNGVKCRAVAADLSALDTLDALIGEAEKQLGELDVLVNNAGMQIVAHTPEVSPEAGEKLLTLNVLAPFRLTHAALRRMIPRGRGTIVDIASLAALAPTPGMFHYSASKAALAAASESLRAEIAPYGLHVVTVYPGPVETQMAQAAVARYAKDPTRGMPTGNTTELAQLILRAVKRRKARVIYPRSYALARSFPGITRKVVDRFSPKPTPLIGPGGKPK
jgi:short-subunit dehydrogenase